MVAEEGCVDRTILRRIGQPFVANCLERIICAAALVRGRSAASGKRGERNGGGKGCAGLERAPASQAVHEKPRTGLVRSSVSAASSKARLGELSATLHFSIQHKPRQT